MPLTDEELIKKFNIKPTDKILDVGGSAKQHSSIKIDTLVDLIKPLDTPYNPTNLSAKNFVELDLTRDKFPFKEKEFDFILCSHTLEDLDTPFLAIEEMERVGKRGYIATPSRGKDSEFSHFNLTDWLTGPRRVPGLGHHKWFFEYRDNRMYISPKNYPLLYTNEFCITQWKGTDEFEFYWVDKIKYKKFDSTSFHQLAKDYRIFMKLNKNLITKGIPLIYLDNLYYFLKELIKLLLRRGQGFKY